MQSASVPGPRAYTRRIRPVSLAQRRESRAGRVFSISRQAELEDFITARLAVHCRSAKVSRLLPTRILAMLFVRRLSPWLERIFNSHSKSLTVDGGFWSLGYRVVDSNAAADASVLT